MDGVQLPARLEWWANATTCLGAIEVAVWIRTTDSGWWARGRPIEDADAEVEGFHLLCELDPIFTLRFADQSIIDVRVAAYPGRVEFDLEEYVSASASAA